jgi:hypothetical protein
MKAIISILVFSICSMAQLAEISLHRTEYLVGEPVYMKIFSQSSKMPISLDCGLLKLCIKKPDSTFEIYRPLNSAPCQQQYQMANGMEISSREYLEEYAPLIFNERGLIFKVPGKYILMLIIDPETQEPVSNQLAITVQMPQKAEDLKAFSIINECQYEYALFMYFEAGENLVQGFDIIKRISEFPNSYQNYARFALSCNFANIYYDFKKNTARYIDLEKAIEYSQCENRKADNYIRIANAVKLKAGLSKAMENTKVGEETNAVIKKQVFTVAKEVVGDYTPLYYLLKAGE